jgi:hypothetical protein
MGAVFHHEPSSLPNVQFCALLVLPDALSRQHQDGSQGAGVCDFLGCIDML